MLIVTATNVTDPVGKKLVGSNGRSVYDILVCINQHCIWKGIVRGHIRKNGAAALLRKLADIMDTDPQRWRG